MGPWLPVPRGPGPRPLIVRVPLLSGDRATGDILAWCLMHRSVLLTLPRGAGKARRPSAPSPSNTTVLGDTGLKAATELTWPVGGPRACVASVLCITGHGHLRVSPFPARAVGRQGREGPRGLELPVRPVHTGPLRERDRRDRPPHGSGPRTLPAAGAFGKDGFVHAVCTRPTWVLTGRGLGKGKAPDAGLARAAV